MTDIPPRPSKIPLLVIIGFAVAGAVLDDKEMPDFEENYMTWLRALCP
jgi:hypothetical protein